MKKILIASYSLGLGGIETALLSLVDMLIDEGNEVTLFLEKNEGIFKNQVNSKVKIISLADFENYKNIQKNDTNVVNNLKNKIIRNMKLNKLIGTLKNKFDSSISFATYSKICAKVALAASNNTSLFVHSDYSFIYPNVEEHIKFFKELQFEKFSNIVFVSEASKENFINTLIKYDDQKLTDSIISKRILCIKNYIDSKKIISKSKENILENSEIDIIQDAKEKKNKIFINVGRHNEHSKRLIRIIDSCIMLNDMGITNYLVIFVGDGEDKKEYENLVKENNLEGNIVFFGKKENPYPYYMISDYVLLTSEYEGYPVVFLESQILEKKLITMDVSDSRKDIDNKTGIVIERNEIALFETMKEVILEDKSENSSYIRLEKLSCKLDIRKYNNNVKDKIKSII